MTSPPRENSSLNTAKRDRDMALAESDRAALRRPNPWVGLWIVLSAAFMGIMDVFITAVAAPAIRADLGATTADMQLILAAYNFSFGLVLITGGRLGDLYGRRRIFSVGLAMFTAASLAASLSPDPVTLILARALLGVGAGLMMPQVFSIIQANFEGEDRGKAFGAFAFVSGLAATTAQIVGGILIAADIFGLGWRTIFLINIPVGVLAFAAAQIWVAESKLSGADGHSLDTIGILLLTFALATLTAPLTFGVERGWPGWAFACFVAFPFVSAAFVFWLRWRARHSRIPLVELSLFSNSSFSIGNVLALLFYANNAALFVALPVFVQLELDHSALISGLIFAPLALAFSLTASGVGRLTAQVGRRLIVVGCVLLLAAYGWLFLVALPDGTQTSAWAVVPGVVLTGIGMGLVQPTINYTTLEHVEPREIGSASGVLNTSFELGYAMGSVLGGAMSLASARGGFLAVISLTSLLVALILTVVHLYSVAVRRHVSQCAASLK